MNSERMVGHCKDCKYFEYDSVAKVYGIPLIVHEICSKCGDGCQTEEDGYCFLFEPKEEKEDWPKWLPKYEGEWVTGKKEEKNE